MGPQAAPWRDRIPRPCGRPRPSSPLIPLQRLDEHAPVEFRAALGSQFALIIRTSAQHAHAESLQVDGLIVVLDRQAFVETGRGGRVVMRIGDAGHKAGPATESNAAPGNRVAIAIGYGREAVSVDSSEPALDARIARCQFAERVFEVFRDELKRILQQYFLIVLRKPLGNAKVA